MATFAVGLTLSAAHGAGVTQPSYSATSVVDSGTFYSSTLARNSLITIFGANLSYDSGAADPTSSLYSDVLGVSVYVDNMRSAVLYVSPGQINFIVRSDLDPGTHTLVVTRMGVAGDPVNLKSVDAVPALFQLPNTSSPITTHADGSLITADAPAHRGEIIVVYCSGLGQTVPHLPTSGAPHAATPILQLAALQVLLNGTAIDHGLIKYAGVTPGFVGLYQVNVEMPGDAPVNPEIRLVIADQQSAPGLKLALP